MVTDKKVVRKPKREKEKSRSEKKQEEKGTSVRTLRFEVMFPGWRKADLSALWSEMWKATDDLRKAANKLISALWQLKIGTLPHPESEACKGEKKGEVRPTPMQTLAYRGMNGTWRPFGESMYQPTTTRPVASKVLLAVAGKAYDRLKTDMADITKGDRSLASFRSMPVCFCEAAEVNPQTGEITLGLWSGTAGQRIKVRPRKLDTRTWRDLRRATAFGSCELVWDKPPNRKGRWMLSLSAHYPKVEGEETKLIAAVRLGMYTSCTLAFAQIADGIVVDQTERINIPASTWRQVRRVTRERRERLQWNRKDRGLRTGRGRKHKLRSADAIGDVVARVTNTALRQTAAAVVNMAIARGASAIALPDLKTWAVAQEMDKGADKTNAGRAAQRRWYFDSHQGTLRTLIEQVARREGVEVLSVSVRGAGASCHKCGEAAPEARAGRLWFHEACGYRVDTEVNTAKNLVKRAIDNYRVAAAEESE